MSSETILGNDGFVSFVDEGKGGAQGAEMERKIDTSDAVSEHNLGGLIEFRFDDVENGVLEIDGIDQDAVMYWRSGSKRGALAEEIENYSIKGHRRIRRA